MLKTNGLQAQTDITDICILYKKQTDCPSFSASTPIRILSSGILLSHCHIVHNTLTISMLCVTDDVTASVTASFTVTLENKVLQQYHLIIRSKSSVFGLDIHLLQ